VAVHIIARCGHRTCRNDGDSLERASARADRRPFRAHRDGRKQRYRRNIPGQMAARLFRLHVLPRRLSAVLNEIGVALDGLGPLANKVQPIFITVDPVHDTARSLAAYLESFDPRIVGLRGAPEQIEAVAKSYHVYYRARSLGDGEYTVDHSSFLYVMKPDGDFAELLAGDLPGHTLADELNKLVK
jgi:SCO1/SenC